MTINVLQESLFDRVLGAVAPRAAARRLFARVQLEQTRAYAGAATGRNTDGWRTSSTSADTEIAIAGPRLRDRSRDLTRNNPHAAKALSSWVANLVGDGIMPRIKDEKLKKLFDDWQSQCDADGQLSFYGLQTLACREMIEAGEVLVRKRPRRLSDGLPVPMQIQVLEADFLDSSKSNEVNPNTNSTTVNGIEFDAIGRRTKYWLYPEHPGNAFATRGIMQSVAVPASDIAHLYEKQRTQVRGVPWCTPIIRRSKDKDDYDLAEMIRKKMASAVVGVVTGFDEEQKGVAPSVVNSKGEKIETFKPGMIVYANGGKQIQFNTPASDSGYGDATRISLHAIAAGYRLPYELLTGDLSEVNFSSMRGGLVEFRRLVSMLQWQMFIPTFCQRIWDWFVEAAYLAGLYPEPSYPVEWSTPKFEWVDPYKDVLADILAVRAGIRSWQDVVAETGRDPSVVLAEIAAANALFDQHKIVLDIDPRHTAKSGVVQVDPAGGGQDNNPPDNTKPARIDQFVDLAMRLAAVEERTNNPGAGELAGNMSELIDAMRHQKPPTVHVRAPVQVDVAIPAKKAERTVVTKHDANGRIQEYERHEID